MGRIEAQQSAVARVEPAPRSLLESMIGRAGDWWEADARASVRQVPIARRLYAAFHISMVALAWRLRGTSAAGVLGRLWAWQLWRRVTARAVIVRCADGSRLYAPAWSRLAGVVAGAGLTEPDDSLFALDFLRPGDLFVDVGANIGFYSVLAARRGARVVAFEPAHDACAVCQLNARLNGIQTAVSVREAACGSAPGTALFTIGLDILNHLAPDDPSAIRVEMTTLDREITGAVIGRLMLKVDAEGHDAEVLSGASDLIARHLPVVLAEIGDGGHAIHTVLSGHAYRSYKYDPRRRRVFEVPAGTRQGGNLLFIADETLGDVSRRVGLGERSPLSAPAVEWRLRRTDGTSVTTSL